MKTNGLVFFSLFSLIVSAPIVALHAQGAVQSRTPPIGTAYIPTEQPTQPAPDLSSAPDPQKNPVLAQFIKGGVKAYFLGVRDGLNGWFLAHDSQIQFAYSTLDNHTIIFGAMFDTLGSNVSSDQLKTLYESNKEVYNLLATYNAQGQNGKNGLPSPTPGAGFPPSGMTAPAGTQAALGQPAMATQNDAAQSMTPPQPTPGEKLIHALISADGVNVGAPSSPRIYMVADPNCPHCQATWKMIRSAVFAGKIEVRIVPIDALGTPESENAAAALLKASDPLNAWDKYIVNGDKSQLALAPDTATLNKVRKNHEVIDAWHIAMTPFIVYRAKTGQVKVEQGEPQDPTALLNDIGL